MPAMNATTKSPICKALPINLGGRDFFVGDIHGCFSHCERALEAAGFDPALDRLISVGDLIDRGRESMRALEWLGYDWFHPIRGNHEDMFLQWMSFGVDAHSRKKFEEETYFRNANGGSWVTREDPGQLRALAQALEQLPYFMAVPHPAGGLIGVVHAELPDGARWPSMINRDIDSGFRETMTWGRERWRSRYGRAIPARDKNMIAGLDALVCGHVRCKEPTGLGNIVFIDTGGWHEKGRFTVMSGDEIMSICDAIQTSQTISISEALLAIPQYDAEDDDD